MASVNPVVLIVDDEAHVLQALQRVLRRDGYDIRVADGGQAAVGILNSQEVAVVICDQRMPGMSGAEVLAEAYRRQPDAVRITLTGYTDLAAAQASINEGNVSHFLLKPWDDDHLRGIVRDGVRKYQLIQERRKLEEMTRRQKEELETWNHRLEEQVLQRTRLLRAQNERLQRLQRELEQSLRDTLRVMVGMLDATKPNVGIHSKRVSELARALGERLELSEEQLRD
ncbi:MAG: response regulator, partial [Phycisphaerae bacterium]